MAEPCRNCPALIESVGQTGLWEDRNGITQCLKAPLGAKPGERVMHQPMPGIRQAGPARGELTMPEITPEDRTAEQPPPVTVTIQLHQRVADLLSVLIGPDTGITDLQGVLLEIIDHVQQGIYRTGSWERPWLEQALGSDWQARLEDDPGTPFERPIPPPPAGPPEWQHQAYGVALTLPDFDDDPVIGGGHADPRRFIAACSRLAREAWGLYRLSDVTRPETAYAAVSHRWAAWERGEVFSDGDWSTGWVLDWTAAEDAPGAFPVTVLQPDPPRPQAQESEDGTDG